MNVNRKVAQGAETRANLIATGRSLFGANGFASTSIEQIAASAEVTKGAFYHHFASKDALFKEVYEAVKRDVTDRVAPSFVEPAPFEALVAGCGATLDAHLDDDVRQITLYDGRSVLGQAVAREIESRYGAVLLRGALRRAMNAGVIDRAPLAPLAQMLNGAMTEGCLLIADSDDPELVRADVGVVILRLLQGLRTSDPVRTNG